MSVWPDYARVERAAWRRGGEADAKRTAMDDGLVRQTPRDPLALVPRRIAAVVDDADIARFRAWAEARSGSRFAWTDDDGVARRVRVRGGAGAIAETWAASGTWRLEMTLEGAWADVVPTDDGEEDE